jgi:hypothetical protein
VQTPQPEGNLPGLPAIAYRAGTWSQFKESMQARLSSSDFPALAGLKTRAADDFTMALIDAGAMALDILTFYTERLANESYLRTAGQFRSVVELSRLIGYEPAPGVSASTFVAFTLKAAAGAMSSPAISIPSGTQIQSVPGQGQTPQTFETSADIQAKADWNALAVQTAVPWAPPGGKVLYFTGTSTQLQPGDALLILGVDRETWQPSGPSDTTAPSDQWDVVVVRSVLLDTVRNLTRVTVGDPLSHVSGSTGGSWPTAKVFAFRQQANLFGYNAPNPALFTKANNNNKTSLPLLIDVDVDATGKATAFRWKNYFVSDSDHIDLDAHYPKVVAGSWFALVLAGAGGVSARLYRAADSRTISRSDFGLSGKVTELAADFHDPAIASHTTFDLLHTSALVLSDELDVADTPLDSPLYGTSVDLRELRADLVGVGVVVITGKRQKLVVARPTGLDFVSSDDYSSAHLNPGAVVTLRDAASLPLNPDGTIPNPDDWLSNAGALTLNVEDASGRRGKITASLSDFALAPAAAKDPTASEPALVSSVGGVADASGRSHTQILLQTNLANCYDRTTTTVNANVGLATHGQSVSEVLGNGSAATPNQTFTLRQSPLTFIQATTPTGRQSTLDVRVNESDWEEVPSLYGHDGTERVYTTSNQSGKTIVRFGDGVDGATLPTGQHNVQAHYRIGSGAAGNVGPGSLTTLMDRPLGVSDVTNPQAATGGQDPETVDDTRSRAPVTVLTLGRAVSIADYRDYAAGFAGISKAHAIWIPSGPGRGVFLTVAGVNGAALPDDHPTLVQLVTSLRDYGNPLIPVIAQSFVETLFGVIAQVAYDPAYHPPEVEADVRRALTDAYSFAKRSFGQGVVADELVSVIQSVPGVVGSNVRLIRVLASSTAGDLAGLGGGSDVANLNDWLSQRVFVPRPHLDSPTRICPYLPVPSMVGLPMPAEILVLPRDPRFLRLGVMA